jgi:hypothetical protein
MRKHQLYRYVLASIETLCAIDCAESAFADPEIDAVQISDRSPDRRSFNKIACIESAAYLYSVEAGSTFWTFSHFDQPRLS